MLEPIALNHDLVAALTPWAWTSVSIGLLGAAWIMVDLQSRPPQMSVMRWVWPLAAIWGSVFGIALYLLAGRAPRAAPPAVAPATTGSKQTTAPMPGMDMAGMSMPGMKMPAGSSQAPHKPMAGMDMAGMDMPGMKMDHGPRRPFWLRVGAGTAHCGAGCSLADMLGGWWFFFFPWVLGGSAVLGEWVGEYILALIFGVGFQYAAIQPMLHLPVGQAVARAFKVDVLSLSSWQVGMYGFMALVFFVWVGRVPPTEIAFWLLMQGAMIAGFFCSYVANAWLIHAGIKPSM